MFKQYRKVEKASTGVILEFNVGSVMVDGNVFKVAEILGADVVISRGGKQSYITWMSGTDSYTARDGDLILFNDDMQFKGIIHPNAMSDWEEYTPPQNNVQHKSVETQNNKKEIK